VLAYALFFGVERIAARRSKQAQGVSVVFATLWLALVATTYAFAYHMIFTYELGPSLEVARGGAGFLGRNSAGYVTARDITMVVGPKRSVAAIAIACGVLVVVTLIKPGPEENYTPDEIWTNPFVAMGREVLTRKKPPPPGATLDERAAATLRPSELGFRSDT